MGFFKYNNVQLWKYNISIYPSVAWGQCWRNGAVAYAFTQQQASVPKANTQAQLQ